MNRALKHIAFLAATSVSASLLFSCESENALAVVSQEEKIEKYVSGTYPDNEIVRNSGSNRVIVSAGDSSEFVAKGDSVTMSLTGYVFNGQPSTEFFSSDVTLRVDEKDMIPGLCNGLVGATPYEESVILFSARYGYYDSAVGLVPSMSALMFKVTVLDIIKKK